jgi:hypothetical protein
MSKIRVYNFYVLRKFLSQIVYLELNICTDISFYSSAVAIRKACYRIFFIFFEDIRLCFNTHNKKVHSFKNSTVLQYIYHILQLCSWRKEMFVFCAYRFNYQHCLCPALIAEWFSDGHLVNPPLESCNNAVRIQRAFIYCSRPT